jgi:hypothetical protein
MAEKVECIADSKYETHENRWPVRPRVTFDDGYELGHELPGARMTFDPLSNEEIRRK